MESRPLDTDAASQKQWFDQLRAMSMPERLALIDRIWDDGMALIIAGVRAMHGPVSPRREGYLVMERMYGEEIATIPFPDQGLDNSVDSDIP